MRKLRASLLVAWFLVFGTCCATLHPQPDILFPLGPVVGVITPKGDALTALVGSGVIIYSSKLGTIILTAGHVALNRPPWATERMPATTYHIELPDKTQLDGAYLSAVLNNACDLGILCMPPSAGRFPTFKGLRETSLDEDEHVTLATFFPEEKAQTHEGIVGDSDGYTVVYPDVSIIPGNSGGAIYDDAGLLVGIIVARNDPKQPKPEVKSGKYKGQARDICYFVSAKTIKEFFEASGLEWSLTLNESDDPVFPEAPAQPEEPK